MADSATPQPFPTEDSLCEQCGYPLKGLSSDTSCPECGADVKGSSPGKRKGPLFLWSMGIGEWIATVSLILFFPRRSFRRMRVDGSNLPARIFLFFVLLSVSILAVFSTWRDWLPIQSHALFIVSVLIALSVQTYIEMLGVTAFSRRRGWRVPFHLAERVCCFAAAGWLPAVFVAAFGSWLLGVLGIDGVWFDQPIGLIRLRWLAYSALFVLSLLWFETLVWVGVRQVKYANAWPEKAQPGHHDL